MSHLKQSLCGCILVTAFLCLFHGTLAESGSKLDNLHAGSDPHELWPLFKVFTFFASTFLAHRFYNRLHLLPNRRDTTKPMTKMRIKSVSSCSRKRSWPLSHTMRNTKMATLHTRWDWITSPTWSRRRRISVAASVNDESRSAESQRWLAHSLASSNQHTHTHKIPEKMRSN